MQSCFWVETDSENILIDPGYFVFNEEGKSPEDFADVDLIIITHEHTDHFDWENIQKIIKMSQPIILATHAVGEVVAERFPEIDLRVISSGFKQKIGDSEIEGYISKHGPLPDGRLAPVVCGVVIEDGETIFYHPGDTIELNKAVRADIIATPICGQVVMNIEQARQQLVELKPRIAIPMHYDNPRFPVDAQEFVKAMEGTGVEVMVLENEQSIDE